MDFGVETLALGDDTVGFERFGVRQVMLHSLEYLTAHLDYLKGQNQSVIAFGQFRHERSARLVSFLRYLLDLDLGRVVGRVDFSSRIERQRDVGAHVGETAVLQFHRPILGQQRGCLLQDGRRNVRQVAEPFQDAADRSFQIVHVDCHVIAHIDIGARYGCFGQS